VAQDANPVPGGGEGITQQQHPRLLNESQTTGKIVE
jgi:hypothetical protein